MNMNNNINKLLTYGQNRVLNIVHYIKERTKKEEIDEDFTLLINPNVEYFGDYVKAANPKEYFHAGDYALTEPHGVHGIFSKISSLIHSKYDIDKKNHEYQIVIISGYNKKNNEMLVRGMGQLDRIKINPDSLKYKIKPGYNFSYDEKPAQRIASIQRKMHFTLLSVGLIEIFTPGSIIKIIKITKPEILALLETFVPGISSLETFLFINPIGHIFALMFAIYFFIRYTQDIRMDERLKRDILGLKFASRNKDLED